MPTNVIPIARNATLTTTWIGAVMITCAIALEEDAVGVGTVVVDEPWPFTTLTLPSKVLAIAQTWRIPFTTPGRFGVLSQSV